MSKKTYPAFVEEFLQNAVKTVKEAQLKKNIKDELLSHLDDAAESDLAKCLSLETSYKNTMARFGDPHKLNKNFKKAHKPWFLRWTYIIPSVLGFTVVVVCLGGSFYAAHAFEKFNRVVNEKKELRKEIVQLHRELKNIDPFFSQTFVSGKDAGEYLNSRVKWNNLTQNSPSGSWTPELGVPPALTMTHFYSVYDIDTTDLRLAAFYIQQSGVSFDWMKELYKYDFWEVFSSQSPAEMALNAGLPLASLPQPDFQEMGQWAKIRLIDGYSKKDLLPALRDVKKLAELVYSAESITATAVAIHMLGTSKQMFERGVREHLIRADSWKPIQFDLSNKARLAAWATNNWTDFFAPNEYKNELFELQPFLGACGAIQEASFGLSNLRSIAYFKAPFFLEKSFTQYFSNYEKFVDTQGPYCRMKQMRYALKNEFHEISLAGLGDDLISSLVHVPYIRQYVFVWMIENKIDAGWLMAYESYSSDHKTAAATH